MKRNAICCVADRAPDLDDRLFQRAHSMKYACSLHLTVLRLRFAHVFASIAYVHIVCVPLFAGLLWLHVVITCPPPPHVHSEMQPSV
ncbi:hypothetical protein GBAR_LOCUS16693, partial [Geodia barretti]